MRGKQTVRDMVLSMAAIGLLAGGIYLFIPHTEDDPVKPVDYRVELGQARRAAPYPVAAPEGLPEQWRATSVRYRGAGESGGAEWHLGFINPQQEYAAVEQSNGPAAKFVADVSKGAEENGTRKIEGTTWKRYDGEKYNALVRQEKNVTTVVTGTAPHDQLAELAAALRTS
ncbi:DUF4245 domain-containing protein [Streptomyces thermolineatus]|uniref:DUF4245 domain-containing protein n=1 Tax=Streptomyces thermolineatus TaxID=44033 RepID=A0ABP5Z964_9ACTN